MNWILPEGASLGFEGLAAPLQIIRGLGGGTQGQVYEVDLEGERLALKWYLPACIARDGALERRLEASIRATAPNEDFLWPIALLRASPASRPLIRLRQESFGYLMPLRPTAYVGACEHAAGRLAIGLRQVLRACFGLADAFHALHLAGLCYKDVSLGNLFLEPGSGGILICDNDNVAVDGADHGAVLGTPGFMAPEVLLGQARPGADSDLFSLAVLLFRLLTRHDPLKGQMELAIRCLDEPARRRLCGEDPVFIFDPLDDRNRPDPIEHAAALITWPIYPRPLQALFEQTFCRGMKQPSRRALTGQWKQELARTLDRRALCPACGQENFQASGAPALCWSCGAPLPEPITLLLPHGAVLAAPDNELHAHHFDALAGEDLRRPLARVVAHPQDHRRLGLRNLQATTWSAETHDGRVQPVQPGESCSLAALARIQSPAGPIAVQRPTRPSPAA
ncbi:protein kinase domain-containing protein [Cyanobium sp. N5-Cardenillas]|uniref:protein kinase domain-containing protein n=1 Tax=Cyanobium sp. N5-Cardenillas TaxID=2823720 RepID=UPI0020CF4DD7|nr:protein kinase [Cyanobium sp. N5-Cardenillas]MCP9787162.1 protein kinase [Cyanobium sp. N5-Cardenillas]